jgi:hypothetical protein
MTGFDHYWRVKTKHPDRFKKPCRVLARGKKNSILVEFEDGFQTLTSRHYVRKIPKEIT